MPKVTGSGSAFSRAVLATTLLLASGAAGFLAYRLVGVRTPSITVAPTPTATPDAASGSAPNASSAPGSASSPPGAEAGAVAGRIPERLPDISLPDEHGVRHHLSEWKGRPVIVNFWATWCAPCRREIPLLKTLRRERSGDSLEVVGIAVDLREAVTKYAHDIGIDYPVLIGEQDGLDAVNAFGMETVFPFSVFADREGRIVTLKIGELHRDEADLILDRLRDIDQGRLALAAAREQISAGMRRLAAERARAPSGPDAQP